MGKCKQAFMSHGPVRNKVQSRSKQPLRDTSVPVVRANRQGAKERNATPSSGEVGTDKFVSQVSSESRRGIRCPASPYVVCIAEEFYWIWKAQKSPKGDPEDTVSFSEIRRWKWVDEHVHSRVFCCCLRNFQSRVADHSTAC